jgi:hypothetical protein
MHKLRAMMTRTSYLTFLHDFFWCNLVSRFGYLEHQPFRPRYALASALPFLMAPLIYLVGLAFSSVSTFCCTLSVGGGTSPVLESRQPESNGLPSVDNFLNRAYHSGMEDQRKAG